MLPKFRNETLQAIVIILLLVMQFVLTMSGHERMTTNFDQTVRSAVAQSAASCPQQAIVVTPPTVYR